MSSHRMPDRAHRPRVPRGNGLVAIGTVGGYGEGSGVLTIRISGLDNRRRTD
jgi:hypothetical protein